MARHPQWNSDRNLWAAILDTYLEDARKKLSDQEVASLIHLSLNEYTREICQILDIEHRQFMNALYRTFAANTYISGSQFPAIKVYMAPRKKRKRRET